jgi:DNA repair photolyase
MFVVSEVLMGRILELIEYKNKVMEKLRNVLTRDSIDKAIKDPHAKRRPRPCGITIHTGVGCSFICAYCYIYDMGFPAKISPYALTSLELVYSLAKNPYIVPYRTFAAYGSVTEPFLPETREKALEYIVDVYRWLYLPSQVSTKIAIDNEIADRLKKAEPNLSVLVSITTIEKADKLEPLAPKPLERFRGIAIASKYGLYPYLFIRPIIPSVTNKELDNIIKLGAEYNAKGIVVGSLRITKSIIQRLRSKGVDTKPILDRAPRLPKDREQISIKINDIVLKVEKIAQDYGLKVFRTACKANVDSHNDYCSMCSFGPCGNDKKKYNIDYNDISEYLEYMNLKPLTIDIRSRYVNITLLDDNRNERKIDIARTILAYACRKEVFIKYT